MNGARTRMDELSIRDLRRGIQSVSRVYVQERNAGGLGGRATGGAARRAAFACYYAPLHFLTAWHLVQSGILAGSSAPSRIIDLGCGTAAVGSALSLWSGGVARVEGIEALGWAAREARQTFKALGLRGRVRRAQLPSGLPRGAEGDWWVAGWFLNECDETVREGVLDELCAAARKGATVLILEPLAHAAAPWWKDTSARLLAEGWNTGLFKQEVELPDLLERLDQASGLDHSTLGVRWLAHVGT